MICFYHRGDLDGHCSGAIVRYSPGNICFPACLCPRGFFSWAAPALLLLALLLAEPTFAESSSQPFAPENCRVMEQYLWIKGHRVSVEAGNLKVEDRQVVAVLDCKTETGFFFTWLYPLGNLERQEALGK
ncbi:MAG: hypothetical protein QME78_00315 [Thermodesulfobacteriota bacterium]|nr:hypothetical protein [Thermodesulfobacteriota bacterium]